MVRRNPRKVEMTARFRLGDLFIDNLVVLTSTYDVKVTYLLAMQELRVQAPLGALYLSQ